MVVHIFILGNHRVWHGRADILLDHSVVKVETQNEEDDIDDTLDYSVDKCDTDEPVLKKRKTENVRADGGDGDVSEDKAVVNTTVVEVKLGKDDHYMPEGPARISTRDTAVYSHNKTLSQVLAQTICNAFLQVKLNPYLSTGRYFIPSFLASEKYVTIHMYRPCDDSLLTQAEAMPLVVEGMFNHQTILCIWMALNMLNFPRAFPKQEDETFFYPKSNFKTKIEPEVLELYQNQLQMPLQNHTYSGEKHPVNWDLTFKYIGRQYKTMKEFESHFSH